MIQSSYNKVEDTKKSTHNINKRFKMHPSNIFADDVWKKELFEATEMSRVAVSEVRRGNETEKSVWQIESVKRELIEH